MTSLAISIMMVLSPLWPFGENPTPNAPFLIVNKQTNELAYVNDSEIKQIHQIATGATNELTPNGLFTIITKLKEPYYRKSNIPGGSPSNPLGTRWIGFNAEGTDGSIYGVHGTNQPQSIGQHVSAGCIRMLNKEIEGLFEELPIGTKIYITDTAKDFQDIAKEMNAM